MLEGSRRIYGVPNIFWKVPEGSKDYVPNKISDLIVGECFHLGLTCLGSVIDGRTNGHSIHAFPFWIGVRVLHGECSCDA